MRCDDPFKSITLDAFRAAICCRITRTMARQAIMTGARNLFRNFVLRFVSPPLAFRLGIKIY